MHRVPKAEDSERFECHVRHQVEQGLGKKKWAFAYLRAVRWPSLPIAAHPNGAR